MRTQHEHPSNARATTEGEVVKIPLPDQIAEQERRREELEAFVSADPGRMRSLHAVEGTILTLRLLQNVEPEFRQFMRERSARSDR